MAGALLGWFLVQIRYRCSLVGSIVYAGGVEAS